MWTLDDALPLVGKIAPIAKRHGFSVALDGSGLDRGESKKDLDLFFVEQDHEIRNVKGCLDEIAKLPEIRRYSSHASYSSVIWLQDGRHIDAQFRME